MNYDYSFGIFKPFFYTFLGTILLYKLLFKSDKCTSFRLTLKLFHTSTLLYITFTTSKERFQSEYIRKNESKDIVHVLQCN